MLKTSGPPVQPIGPDEGRPVGELVHQLVDDGKAYAKAELNLARTIATAKARSLAIPAALIGTALLFAIAAVSALAFGIVLALAKFVGPVAAGVIGMLLFGAVAGGLGWFAVGKARAGL